jgi:hypothetical protein
VKYCWNWCCYNFSFPNKFVTLLPCGLLVDSNTFLKYLTSYTGDGCGENQNVHCSNNKNKGNEQLMLVIFQIVRPNIRSVGLLRPVSTNVFHVHGLSHIQTQTL